MIYYKMLQISANAMTCYDQNRVLLMFPLRLLQVQILPASYLHPILRYEWLGVRIELLLVL